MSDDNIAVGGRVPLGEGGKRYQTTCADCGAVIYFRDATPWSIPIKICGECWTTRIEAGDRFTLKLTPENVAYIRAMLAASRRRPS